MTYRFEHSIQCQVSRDFAWKFWTNTDNWSIDPAVESVRLDGPFAAGTKGATKSHGSDPVHWELIEVHDGQSAVVEIAVPGATVRFLWIFEDSQSGTVRITQRVILEGERADDYAQGMTELEKGIPQGMQKLAEAMARAASEQG